MKRPLILLFILIIVLAVWGILENPSLFQSLTENPIAGVKHKDEPQTAAEYNDRGVEYQRAAKFSSAADHYRKAIELDPDSEAGLLAYENLETLSKGIKELVESQPANWSRDVFSSGVAHFDKAVEFYNAGNYTEAKRYLDLAMRIFASSRTIDTGNGRAHGFLYLSKGFFYYICALENIKSIRSSDSNYTAMAYLRKACYPFTYAGEYYELARECFEEREIIDFVDGYRKKNDKDYNISVKRFLPQLDYWSAAFVKSVKKDVQCAVTIDRINETVVAGEYDKAVEIALKFEKELGRMKENTTGNRDGFIFLNLAYVRLAALLPYLSEGKYWTDEQKAKWVEQLELCAGDLKRARFEFGTASYAGLCDNLINYVARLENFL